MQIPVGGVVCLLLEPGTSITHAAIALAADCGTLLIWIGEGGVRLYSAGQPGGARADRLLYQARLALEDPLRLGHFHIENVKCPSAMWSDENKSTLKSTAFRS